MSGIFTDGELVDLFQSAPDGVSGLRAIEAAVVAALTEKAPDSGMGGERG